MTLKCVSDLSFGLDPVSVDKKMLEWMLSLKPEFAEGEAENLELLLSSDEQEVLSCTVSSRVTNSLCVQYLMVLPSAWNIKLLKSTAIA